MQALDTPVEEYPYTDADVEGVKPSQIRLGDLVAYRGPVGSGRWGAGPALSDAQYAGHSSTWNDDTYRVEYRNQWGRELYFTNPERLRVYRVRADRRSNR